MDLELLCLGSNPGSTTSFASMAMSRLFNTSDHRVVMSKYK